MQFEDTMVSPGNKKVTPPFGDLIYPKQIFLERFWVIFSLLSCLITETFFGLGANHTNEPVLIGASLQKASFVLVRVSNL